MLVGSQSNRGNSVVKSLANVRKFKKHQVLSLAAVGVASALAQMPSAKAATFTWTNGDTTSLWNSTSTTLAWKNATAFPNAAGAIAQGGTASGNNGTANLNINVTVGEVRPGTTGGGAGFSINGSSNTLTFDGTGITNDFGNVNVAAIRDASSTGSMNINANISMLNTDLDIGWVNTLDTVAINIGTLGVTTLNNAGNTGSSTAAHTLFLRSNTKGGAASPSIVFNSDIGTSGASMAISDLSVGAGGVYLLGIVGSSVTTVSNAGTTRLFLGNTGNAYTGDTNISAGAILNIGKGYNANGVGQVIPIGAGKGNLVLNGTLELAGNSQQVNALNGTSTTAVVQSTTWDGFVGGGTATFTVGNNNSSGAYAGKISQTTSGRILQMVKTGSGTEIFTNSGNVLASYTLSGGTLQIGDGTNATANLGNNFAGAAVGVADNANLSFNYNGAVSVPNAVTGTGTVTQIGSAPLTLAAAGNTFSGGLIISSSGVVAGNANAGVLGSGTVTMSAGTNLDTAGFSPTTGLLSASTASPIITNTGSTDSVLTITGSSSQTFAGVIQKGTTNLIGITKAGTGTQILTGANTYLGATTVNAGKLVLTAPGSLSNTAISVVSGGTFSARPGSATVTAGDSGAGTLGATLTLNPGTGSAVGAGFDMTDGAIGVFNLSQQSGFSGTALTLGGAGTSTNAPQLTFELGSSSADEIALTTGGVSIGATSATINLALLSGTTSLTPGNYTLINAPAGGLSPLMLSSNSMVVGAQSYSLSLANSTSTAEILTIGINNTTPINAYWTGVSGTSWSSTGPTNFSTDHAGTTAAAGIPGGGSNVFMTADAASSANLSTTLDGAFNINSLTFTGTGTTAATTAVTIAAGSGGSLTLMATNSFNDSSGTTHGPGTALLVQAGSAAHSISAPITLGATQTWEVANSSANPLTVSGVISDGGLGYSLTKTGVGTLVLSAANTYGGTTGVTNVAGGTLVTSAAGAIPAGTSLIVANAKLDSGGFAQTVAGLSDGGVNTGTIVNSGAATTFTVNTTAANTFSGSFNASNLGLSKQGTGSLTLSGVNTIAALLDTAGTVNIPTGGSVSATTVNIPGGTNGINVTGGSLTASGTTTLSSGSFPLSIASGSANLQAVSISPEAANNNALLLATGGTVSATSITINRTALSYTTEQGAGSTITGVYINGAAVTVSGALNIGVPSALASSSASVRLDSGSLTVGGVTTIGLNNGGRWSILDIAGGTFTSNDTTTGIQVGGPAAGNAEFLVRGGVANVNVVTLGQGAIADTAEVIVNGGKLYVGAGGIVGAGTASTNLIKVGNGTLAASADWSSSVNVNLTGSATTGGIFQAANASGGATNITLTGIITGTGALNKTGAGTLTLANAPSVGNGYTGLTTISGGTLNINGTYALGGAVYSGITFNGGTLQYAASLPTTNGGGDITQNTAATPVAKPVTFAAGGATIDTNGNDIAFANTIGNGGTGGLNKVGLGHLNVSGGTYSGATNVIAGTLYSATLNGLSATSAYNVSTGTLDASAFNNSIASLIVGTGGTLNLGMANTLTDTGTASLSGILNLSGVTPTAPSINLITYTSETGSFSTVTGVPSTYSLVYTPTALELMLISTGPANLTWNNTGGTGDGLTWDTAQQNFNNGTAPAVFSNGTAGAGDNVTFNDTNNGHYAVTITGTVTPSSLVVDNSTGNYTFGGSGSIGGAGGLVKTGTGSLTLSTSNTYAGSTNVSNGSVILANAHALPTGTNLSIASGASVVANNLGAAAAVQVGSLSVSGKLDLNNNALVVHSSTLTAVRTLVASGYAGGSWNGATGIMSTSAATNPSHLTALGVIANDNGSGSALYGTGGSIATTFAGSTPVLGDVLVKYTYYGDANLDGKVDGTDYARVDSGFLTAATGWYNGDFNYDGKVNGSDYTLLDNAYNTQGAQIASAIASPTAQIAAGNSSVPEPTTLGLLGIGALGLLGRRTRRAL